MGFLIGLLVGGAVAALVAYVLFVWWASKIFERF